MFISYGFKRALIILAVVALLGLLVLKTSVLDGITLIKPEWAGMTVGGLKDKFSGVTNKSGSGQSTTPSSQGDGAGDLLGGIS